MAGEKMGEVVAGLNIVVEITQLDTVTVQRSYLSLTHLCVKCIKDSEGPSPVYDRVCLST